LAQTYIAQIFTAFATNIESKTVKIWTVFTDKDLRERRQHCPTENGPVEKRPRGHLLRICGRRIIFHFYSGLSALIFMCARIHSLPKCQNPDFFKY